MSYRTRLHNIVSNLFYILPRDNSDTYIVFEILSYIIQNNYITRDFKNRKFFNAHHLLSND